MEREHPQGDDTDSTTATSKTPVAHGQAQGESDDHPPEDASPEQKGAEAGAGREAGTPEAEDTGAQEPSEPESGAPGTGDEPRPGGEPDELSKSVQEMEARIQELEREREDANNRWLRSRADYDNLVRRTDREREEIRKTASARVISEVLPQVEILERAAREIAEVDEGHAKGIRLAVQSLKAALEKEGLQEVPGEGAPFDPHHHEAVTREESDAPEGTVTQVIRPGYTLHDKLLQAALVKVSAGPGEKEAEEASSEASKTPT